MLFKVSAFLNQAGKQQDKEKLFWKSKDVIIQYMC